MFLCSYLRKQDVIFIQSYKCIVCYRIPVYGANACLYITHVLIRSAKPCFVKNTFVGRPIYTCRKALSFAAVLFFSFFGHPTSNLPVQRPVTCITGLVLL